jgi:hypothetical protein
MMRLTTPAERFYRWRKIWLFLPVPMLLFAGCSVSDDPNMWYNKTVAENFSGRSDPSPSPPPSSSAAVPAPAAVPGAAPNPPLAGTATAVSTYPAGPSAASAPRALPEGELYRSEASCGGAVLGSGPPPSVSVSQSISLGMTECEVARRLGAPDRMELGATGDQRLLTLTYGRGEHPRLYRFASGHLYAIEALPPPTRAARTAASPR